MAALVAATQVAGLRNPVGYECLSLSCHTRWCHGYVGAADTLVPRIRWCHERVGRGSQRDFFVRRLNIKTLTRRKRDGLFGWESCDLLKFL